MTQNNFLPLSLDCTDDPLLTPTRVWDGTKTVGSEAIYPCEDEVSLSYGVCKPDGTWAYESLVGNVSKKLTTKLIV